MKFSAAVILSTASTALSLPGAILEKRAKEMCGQYDSTQVGDYEVFNNLWNMDKAEGQQCTTVSNNGSSLAWSTNWSWSSDSNEVISYANAVYNTDQVQLSGIGSMPSTWSWTYDGTDLVANVAYDLFTSSTPDGAEEYEIMIWLAALGGAGPISNSGEPIASPEVGGYTWDLYDGTNGQMQVYSFVVGEQVSDFQGDLKEFVDYLTNNQDLDANQYLLNVGAGTEPFRGSDAVFTTSAYEVAVN